MRYPIQVAALTDVGLQRSENQDAVGYFYDEPEDLHLLIVADGMGGAACGSLASQATVNTIQEIFFDAGSRTLKMPSRLKRALIAANHEIWQRATRASHCQGMGATCVVLVIANNQVWVAHVGDSRVYQVMDNRIMRLTRDHSHVHRLLEGGLISEEEAQHHPERNRIERALGPREIVIPELREHPIQLTNGDSFILCTDGLTSVVLDEEIFSVVLSAPSQLAAETLIELAKQRGGPDNISVAVARVGDEVTRAF